MITSIILISQQTSYIVFNILHDIEMFHRSINQYLKNFIQYLQHLKYDFTCSVMFYIHFQIHFTFTYIVHYIINDWMIIRDDDELMQPYLA